MKLKFADKSLKLQIYHREGGESLPQICRIESCCMIGTSTGSLHLDLAIADCEALHDPTFIDDTCSFEEIEALDYYDTLYLNSGAHFIDFDEIITQEFLKMLE